MGGKTKIFEGSDRFIVNLKINLLEIFIGNSLFKLCFPPSYKYIHAHIQDCVDRSLQLPLYKVFFFLLLESAYNFLCRNIRLEILLEHSHFVLLK